ncbi:MAG TPA: SH3 domain-containing protein, partial [Burkholderiaceae bacterium]|nr:SH3 domain-containing protein [Burkholderiaceae bacterium]
AAAERAFAERLLRTGDRRLWFARGNCFFREGDLARAVWAFECARLGMPRDPELLANLALARQRLELGAGSQPFVDALVQLRARFTGGELALLAAAAMTVAALALCFWWRRPAARWIGFLALAPGLALAAELLWLAPARAPAAIALGKLELSSEPRTGLPPVATVAAGQRLELRSEGDGDWVRVEAEGRIGYARHELVGRIE